MAEYDVVVVGLGVMGSAALHRLARRGKRVLGIEQFLPGHDRGSSHGETRLIRLAYFEDASYVPLLREAYGLWRELEEESDRSLMTITGILEIGTPDGELVSGTLASSRLHSLPHDVMTADETMKRFPALVVPSGYTGVFQPDGGYLAAESTVQAQIDLALAAGVDIKADTHVDSIVPQGIGVRLKTSAGEIDAGAAVVTAGPWLNKLLPSLAAPLSVTRQVLGWLSPAQPDQFTANKFPVFLFESELGLHYGFPVHGHSGLKISKHHHLRERVDPDTCDRKVSPQDVAAILDFRDKYLPSADGPLTSSTTCVYTMTPDEDFIIDHLPGLPQIVIASPSSGHGFKFAPVIGEIVSDLVTSGATGRNISRFRLSRFG